MCFSGKRQDFGGVQVHLIEPSTEYLFLDFVLRVCMGAGAFFGAKLRLLRVSVATGAFVCRKNMFLHVLYMFSPLLRKNILIDVYIMVCLTS